MTAADDPRPRLWEREYAALVAGQTVSWLGTFAAYVALPLYMAFLTGSAFGLGLTLAAETIPALLLGMAGGVFLDRWPLRRALISADLVRAAAFGLLALAAAAGTGRGWMVIGAALVVGTMSVLFDNGLRALVPAVVADEALVGANARLQLARTIALTAGPALGGVLVGSGSYALALGFNAATFIVSAVSLSLLEARPAPHRAREGFRRELRDGLSYLFRDPLMRWATVAVAAANLLIAPLEATLVLFAGDDLGLSDQRIGLVYAIGGAAAAVVALLSGGVVGRLGLGRSIIAGLILVGTGMLGVARAGGFVLVAAGTAVGMAGVVWLNVAGDTMWQRRSPPVMRGRVIAASRTLAMALLPVGAAAGGALGERFGLGSLYAASALALLVMAVLLLATPLRAIGGAEPARPPTGSMPR